ncbi:MAG: HNH endonuclease family protein [Nitrosomonas sp.]|uniref:HNH endonuclease family protein n=1 Tax=Nitrosomonas sp. TaxID=42353 RepID=UPI00275B26C4|nr:HNH endonuclease family protein [Nitrosomonas sp.]MDP3608650.1 HNH endonuclease family protein [Methylophilus sp.]MDZ4107776.1 HNH endonuclease family protein [Nitrosomonas sp.]
MKEIIIESKGVTCWVFLLIATLGIFSGCSINKQESYPNQDAGISAYQTPYNRKDWPHWIDADGDCQNSRQEMLIANSKIPVQFKDSKHCTVIYGEWIGAYTGRVFTKASDVDIDHVVPLAHAHRHGAGRWSRAQRREFANDFENLIVVSDSVNKSKSDKAPHEWLPPLKSYWCEYGKRWERIKDKYKLWYSSRERAALNQLAKTCFE